MEIDTYLNDIIEEYQQYQQYPQCQRQHFQVYSEKYQSSMYSKTQQDLTKSTILKVVAFLQDNKSEVQSKNVIKEFLENIGEPEFKKALEQWLEIIGENPAAVAASHRHHRILLQYMFNLQQHVRLFLDIDKEFDRYFTSHKSDLSLRSCAWSAMDFVLQYFFFDSIQFYMPHFFINMSYLTVDDFIDREHRQPDEKKQFMEYCTKRLMGFPVEAQTREMKVANRITQMLEANKPRFFNLALYGNIMTMCTTEYRITKAMKQIQQTTAEDREYLDHVLCKGATTMITLIELMESSRIGQDGVKRHREVLDTKEKKGFFIRWGFMAQLLDDMRDLKEDREVGTYTFLNTRSPESLEKCVRGLLFFILNHLTVEKAHQAGFKGHAHLPEALEMMRNIQLLEFFYALIKHRDVYREPFIREIECYSAVPLDWFQECLQYKFKGDLYQEAFAVIDSFYG